MNDDKRVDPWKLPESTVCGNCGRKVREHYPRADWMCPGNGGYFNQPSKLTRRIAEAAGYTGLSEPGYQWSSDIEGLVEHIRKLASR